MKEPTGRVVFRQYAKKEVVALFPDLVADCNKHVVSYAHLGQHGAADYQFVVRQTQPANPNDPGVVELRRELTKLGYRLKVVRRRLPRRD